MALIKKLRKAKREAPAGEKPELVKTHLRNMIIVPEMIGSVVGVYNGKTFNQIEIKPEMIGHYLAEFSISYKPVKHGRPGIGATHSSRFIPLKWSSKLVSLHHLSNLIFVMVYLDLLNQMLHLGSSSLSTFWMNLRYHCLSFTCYDVYIYVWMLRWFWLCYFIGYYRFHFVVLLVLYRVCYEPMTMPLMFFKTIFVNFIFSNKYNLSFQTRFKFIICLVKLSPELSGQDGMI